jgi:hypothetical protein
MLPQCYQKCLQAVLNQKQYWMVCILFSLLQRSRDVRLERLVRYWTQPIQYDSRRRALQRFLILPQLSVKLLWFPIIKQLIKQQFPKPVNHQQRRRQNKLKRLLGRDEVPLLLIIDRTHWRDKNLLVVSVAWQGRALPIYWQLLHKYGNSTLRHQKALLAPVFHLLKKYDCLLLADREFHSPLLADWLQERGVDFALRQKRNTHIQLAGETYRALRDLDIQPGARLFLRHIHCTKTHQSGPYNLGVRWQRGFGTQERSEIWYILTSLPTLKATIAIYKLRFGIEPMFRDFKQGAYDIEQTRVSEPRFLALVLLVAMTYTLQALRGFELVTNPELQLYLTRRPQRQSTSPHHSHFQVDYNAACWSDSFPSDAPLNARLRELNPHKHRDYERGLRAQALVRSAFSAVVTL